MSRSSQSGSGQPFPAPRAPALERYDGSPFSTADLVLLCSFREDLAGERPFGHLRDALLAAGFSKREARRLIADSLLLRRSSRDRYTLRPPHR